MEAVWKLRVGAEAYYLAQIARGLDEYYMGAGEAPGLWTGGGIAGLGLSGEVDAADLRAVLAGLAPDTGLSPNGTTLRTHPRRVPGFDLTYSVPKSVSLAYALGDRRIQHLIVGACEAALGETLGWLEREACFVRRGTNKTENRETWGERWGTRRMVANGFVAAVFRHRTSRAGDPHLHWHVLVANMAQGVDGRWSALDGTAIYATSRTAGVVFQAAMRRELTTALGVEWGPMHNDSAEIACIPGRVLRAFSQRHEQIAEWLDSTGQSGPAAAATAQREPLVSRPDFEAVQETIRSNTRTRAPRTRNGGTNIYPLRGRMTCGVCGRLMQGHQARGQHYYRCRYTAEYARSAALPHPLNVYLREEDLLSQIDEWLGDLFSPERIESTLDLLLQPDQDTETTLMRARFEEKLRDCDRKIGKYRALLDEGVDPSLVAGWLKEVTATRQLTERRLVELLSAPSSPLADRQTLRQALDHLGGMRGVLTSGDQGDRARFYEAVGISGVYKPQDNHVVLTTNPVGHMVRVGGGT